jgi:hypothetical protein
MFNATFNNISVISKRSVLLVEETGVSGETTDLSKVTDKRYYIMLYRVHTLTMWKEKLTMALYSDKFNDLPVARNKNPR